MPHRMRRRLRRRPRCPRGILAAVPFQNRLDVAQGIFQVKLYNGTAEPLAVAAVQLVWDGMTSELSARSNTLAAGDRIDFPVTLAPARCVGDGTLAEMPPVDLASVRVVLAGGGDVDAPVFDLKRFAQKLYLEDCERQRIVATVDVEWGDLHETVLEGRPVTEGMLRLTRLAGADDQTIVVSSLSNTIIFTVTAGTPDDNGTDGDVAVLAAGDTTVAVAVLFVEGALRRARTLRGEPAVPVLRPDRPWRWHRAPVCRRAGNDGPGADAGTAGSGLRDPWHGWVRRPIHQHHPPVSVRTETTDDPQETAGSTNRNDWLSQSSSAMTPSGRIHCGSV